MRSKLDQSAEALRRALALVIKHLVEIKHQANAHVAAMDTVALHVKEVEHSWGGATMAVLAVERVNLAQTTAELLDLTGGGGEDADNQEWDGLGAALRGVRQKSQDLSAALDGKHDPYVLSKACVVPFS